MFTVTDQAALAIRGLTTGPDVPDGAGLRIAGTGSAGELQLTVAASPRDGDAVIDADGARVFVDRAASEVLEGSALDARVDVQGETQFAVTRRPG
jgi:Fe-S cluster assembly iron-binding protein IscA